MPHRVVVLRGASHPAEPEPDATYATGDLALRDALLRQGVDVVFVCDPDSASTERLARSGPTGLATGTLFVEEGRFHGPRGSTRLPPKLRALATLLDTEDFVDADAIEQALYSGPGHPSRVHSALARLRRALDGAVESAYGSGWRLRRVARRVPPPPSSTC